MYYSDCVVFGLSSLYLNDCAERLKLATSDESWHAIFACRPCIGCDAVVAARSSRQRTLSVAGLAGMGM